MENKKGWSKLLVGIFFMFALALAFIMFAYINGGMKETQQNNSLFYNSTKDISEPIGIIGELWIIPAIIIGMLLIFYALSKLKGGKEFANV